MSENMKPGLVIADLIRNPWATWQWMPDQVRHDNQEDGRPQPDGPAMTRALS